MWQKDLSDGNDVDRDLHFGARDDRMRHFRRVAVCEGVDGESRPLGGYGWLKGDHPNVSLISYFFGD